MDGMLKINGIISNYINYAMQRNYIPIIRQLVLANNSQTDMSGLTLKITASPEFVYEYTVNVSSIPAGGSIQLDAMNLSISSEYLLGLTERLEGELIIEVSDCEGSTLEKIHHRIDVLAFDEWSGSNLMPELLTAFVTPNHPDVTSIIVKSAEILRKWGKDSSFSAYQSNNPNTVRLFMAAIYKAIQNENITYCVPPASFEEVGQRVRLADSLMNQKLGTCLDLSLFYAACLEAIGLNPILVLLDGHCLTACWLEEECFPEIIQDDSSLLLKRIVEGINEICAVECTSLTNTAVSFDDSCVEARNEIAGEKFRFFIDVHRARAGAIRPLPIRRTDENGKLVIEEYKADVKTEDEAGSAPRELSDFGKLSYTDKIEVSRKTLWERKLLDLSLRNTLVSFRVTKGALQLLSPDLGELENALSSGSDFRIVARAKDWDNPLRDNKFFSIENNEDAMHKLARDEFSGKRLRCFLDDEALSESMKHLYRQAKVSLEENGTNTLYLALGFLRWYESDVSEKARYAPLVLLPVDIVRKIALKGYIIRLRDEEAQMNITALEMLRQFFGINIGGLDPLPCDESGIDIKLVFSTIRQAVKDKSRWDVEELAFVGLFSFSQFIMWNDIRNRSAELENNKLVASLMEGRLKWTDTDFRTPEDIDSALEPDEIALPISCDSSQLAAVCAAGEGKSFVLHGPPGTGKSQTITNIIANALFKGQSVLFVAEKMAALSVVQRRLAGIGLEPFCLELHSNKSKKKSVLDQLERSLETVKTAPREDYAAYSRRVSTLRAELNDFSRAMHTVREYGFSLYDVLSRCVRCDGDTARIKGTDEFVSLVSTEKLLLWRDILKEIAIADSECGGICGNPLREMTKLEYTPNLRSDVQDILDKYTELIGKQLSYVDKIRTDLGISRFETTEQLKSFTIICETLMKTQGIPPKLFMFGNLAGLAVTIDGACTAGEARDALRKKILDSFKESVFTLDPAALSAESAEAAASWFIPKALKQGKLLKKLAAHAKNPAQYKKTDISAILDELSEYKKNSDAVKSCEQMLAPLYENTWCGGNPKWSDIRFGFEQARTLRGAITLLCASAEEPEYLVKFAGAVIANPDGFRQCCGAAISGFAEATATILRLEQSLSDIAGIDFVAIRDDEKYLSKIMELSCRWRDSLAGIRCWSLWLGIKSKALEAGLSCAVSAVESGDCAAAMLEQSFLYSLFRSCAEKTISEEAVLSQFSGMLFEDKINKFRELIAQYEQLTREELVSKLSARIPSGSQNAAASSEIGILQRAIKSGGRMLSIRKLFESIPQLLRRLCPCMLMSPISVAQYIDPSFEQFDLVVFDEASQLPTSSAVGAIARGKNVIVVGDPKQLPPTSFFSSNQYDEENFDKEDLESILDDCLALSMPSEHLLWHYRSRHESLIAFSNMQFYENKLYTFPSPNDLVSNVKLIPVEGYYDRGGSKQNKAEAEQIVAEILRRLRDEKLRTSSIGVVTFSVVQQNLIDDLLVDAFAKEPELEEFNSTSDEPLFIKNLENVQGDERDVIMFSVGYAPDKDGKLTLNFGPLNRDGGWRRLNVAVSRARKEMLVYSVLRPEQIDLSRTLAQGVAGLKAFLEFAQRGKSALPEKQEAAEKAVRTNGIENEIAARIASLGYEVKTAIGASEYKIDIGVVNPDSHDEYLLGILLDGSTYAAAKTARDRNIAQASVLKSLGWRLCRVWLLDWWDSPDKVMEKIRKAIADAKANKPQKEAPVKPIKPSQPVQTAAESPKQLSFLSAQTQSGAGKTYKVTELDKQDGGANAFCDKSMDSFILAQISNIMITEAPISRSLFRKRLLSAWGVTRITAKLEQRLDELVARSNISVVGNGSAIFYWQKGVSPLEYAEFRTPLNAAERRGIEDIPVQETANAVMHLLNEQIGMSRQDLVKQTYKLYGFTRTSEYIEQAVSDAAALLSQMGKVKIDDDKISV